MDVDKSMDGKIFLKFLKTRMLAINVSIPNLTVARQEQLRSPQLYESRERNQQSSDVGVG